MSAGCADQDKDKYVTHEPLNLNIASIRLIEILEPGADNGVRCKIRHVDMTDPITKQYTKRMPRRTLPYTCLSYVWGPPDDLN